MPNDTRSGLKISGNRSYWGMNPPQRPDLNIIEAVWDQLDRERNKRQPTSKEELWDVLQEYWRTIPEDHLKQWQEARLRGFRLCWRIKELIPSINFKLCRIVQLCLCLIYCISNNTFSSIYNEIYTGSGPLHSNGFSFKNSGCLITACWHSAYKNQHQYTGLMPINKT